MSERVEGTVEGFFENHLKSKKTGKPFTMYSIKVDGETFSCGFNKPAVKEGDYVELMFDVQNNGKYSNNVVVEGSIKAATKPVNASGASATKAEYWAEKEARDLENDRVRRLHAARASAIEFVSLAHTLGCLPQIDKAKADAKLDVLYSVLDEVTNKFFASTEMGSDDDMEDADLSFEIEE